MTLSTALVLSLLTRRNMLVMGRERRADEFPLIQEKPQRECGLRICVLLLFDSSIH